MKVHRPSVQLDARGRVATHGPHTPERGVVHTTECSDAQGIKEIEGVVNFWHGQGLGYGAQIIIDKDGNSALCANPTEVVWAVEHRNTGTVSVELIGFARFVPKVWFVRRKQLDKLAKWMAWLRLEYGIPLDFNVNRGWSGHRDQPNQSHTDPGIGFPTRYVLRRARHFYQEGWS